MDLEALTELGVGDALAAFGELRRVRDDAERDTLLLAAHYADLHNSDSRRPEQGPQLPGTEQPVRLAGAGTPLVWEFAVAELAVELHTSTWAVRRLIGDALELRHRLPKLWAGVGAGRVLAWRARKVAQATRDLSVEQARFVDREVVGAASDAISAHRFGAIVEAKVIAADPEAAAEREKAAAAQRFAKVGQSNDHGQKTLYVRTSAAEMTRIDATIAYLAHALRVLGDRDDEDRRRTKAMLILANPTQAVALLQTIATRHRRHTDPGPDPTTGPGDATGADESSVRSDERQDGPGPVPTGGLGGAGWFAFDDGLPLPEDPPLDPDGDDPPPPPDPADDQPRPVSTAGAGSGRGSPGDEPAGRFLAPFHPADVPPCGCRGGTWRPDPHDLMPQVMLYLHGYVADLSAASADGIDGSGDASPSLPHGVVRWEGEGPLSSHYLRELLGPWCRFTVKGVVDLANQAPVDAYEIPARHREALHLRTPADVFPFAVNLTRAKQVDHTLPYRFPDTDTDTEDHGGQDLTIDRRTGSASADNLERGQTGLHNLGPMTTFHHRVKTHARGWKVVQPFPGIYLWQAPHGSVFGVDHTGTTQLRGPRTSHGYVPAAMDTVARSTSSSPLEERFGSLVAA